MCWREGDVGEIRVLSEISQGWFSSMAAARPRKRKRRCGRLNRDWGPPTTTCFLLSCVMMLVFSSLLLRLLFKLLFR
jgi:hypothetical protein